VKISLWHLATN